jgi:hypothetical protein
VVDLLDKAGVKQVLDLFTDEVLPLNGLLLRLMLHQPGIRVDLQMVLNHLQGMLDIRDGCQANTSTLAQRKAMSASSYLSPRFTVLRVVWVASVLI